GWSETGGPWVKPEQAMKKLVWSETRVEGPRQFTGKLPQPPSVNGRFQSLPGGRGFFGGGGENAPPGPPHYRDNAGAAYRRAAAADVRMADLHPKVTTSAGAVDPAPLLDGDLTTTMALPVAGEGKPAWIQFDFAEPLRARAFSIAVAGRGIPNGEVQASEDG